MEEGRDEELPFTKSSTPHRLLISLIYISTLCPLKKLPIWEMWKPANHHYHRSFHVIFLLFFEGCIFLYELINSGEYFPPIFIHFIWRNLTGSLKSDSSRVALERLSICLSPTGVWWWWESEGAGSRVWRGGATRLGASSFSYAYHNPLGAWLCEAWKLVMGAPHTVGENSHGMSLY